MLLPEEVQNLRNMPSRFCLRHNIMTSLFWIAAAIPTEEWAIKETTPDLFELLENWDIVSVPWLFIMSTYMIPNLHIFLLFLSYELCYHHKFHMKLCPRSSSSIACWDEVWLDWLKDFLLSVPSHRAPSGWIWLTAVITSIFQIEPHLMTSSDTLNARQCFPVQVSDVSVQQRLCSANVLREEIEKKTGSRSRHHLGKQCFTRSWTCAASSSCYKDFPWIQPNHYVVTLVLVSHMTLYVLMYVVYDYLLLNQSVSINLQSFTDIY